MDRVGKFPLRSLVVLAATVAVSSPPEVTCSPVWESGVFALAGTFGKLCASETAVGAHEGRGVRLVPLARSVAISDSHAREGTAALHPALLEGPEKQASSPGLGLRNPRPLPLRNCSPLPELL